MKPSALIIAIALASPSLAACLIPKPPSEWARGGAPLELPNATWEMNKEDRMVISTNGKVTLNGKHQLTLDRNGRVFGAMLPRERLPFMNTTPTSGPFSYDESDREEKPYVLLMPSGELIGPNDNPWGFVGAFSASLPEKKVAWITINPAGAVTYYDEDDEEEEPWTGGTWRGCAATPRTQWACTLVTYLYRLSGKMADAIERARNNRAAQPK